MQKMLSVKLDAALYERLESMAARQGVSKSFLVRETLQTLLTNGGDDIAVGLLDALTAALRNNSTFPLRVDWKRVERELSASKPPWPTADEAMKHSRTRR